MIETDRLILRCWEPRDAAPFAALNADPEVMEHLGGPIVRAQSDAVIARIEAAQASNGHCFWAVECKADGAMIGFCGLHRPDHAGTSVEGEVEIGWRLARTAWGRGYALEAARASLAWGWKNTDLARIAAWTVPANVRSWGLMERLGMVRRPELDVAHPAFGPGHPLSRHIV